MDSRNVLFAIICSTVVLVVWSYFFEPPNSELPSNETKISNTQNNNSPTIEEDEKKIKKFESRNDLISKTKRIKIENENIKGSLSLQGAVIDDIIFKNYKETLNSENEVAFLNPINSSNEYEKIPFGYKGDIYLEIT